jgi:hypothetical protein
MDLLFWLFFAGAVRRSALVAPIGLERLFLFAGVIRPSCSLQ